MDPSHNHQHIPECGEKQPCPSQSREAQTLPQQEDSKPAFCEYVPRPIALTKSVRASVTSFATPSPFIYIKPSIPSDGEEYFAAAARKAPALPDDASFQQEAAQLMKTNGCVTARRAAIPIFRLWKINLCSDAQLACIA